MIGQLYKGVDINSNEPVNYVGVHPLVWHDHPEQPELGFTELDVPTNEDVWEMTFKEWLSTERPTNAEYIKGFEEGLNSFRKLIETH